MIAWSAWAPSPARGLPTDEDPGAFLRLVVSVWEIASTMGGQTWAFLAFAVLALSCAIVTVSSRNPVAAAVWLVGSFCSVAVCYVLMSATFLAALQVLVYAGAMMVLFVFVVMILDVDDTGRMKSSGRRRVLSTVGGLALTGVFGWILLGTLTRQVTAPGRSIDSDFGTAASLGRALFGPGLFAFEAVSILLLAAVIGAVVVARSRRDRLKDARGAGASAEALLDAGLAGDESARASGGDAPPPASEIDFGQPSAGGHQGGV